MRVRSWAHVTVFGLPALDVCVALLLSAVAVVGAAGASGMGEAHRAFAAVSVLAMTLPVAWCRRAPVGAAAVLAAGSLFTMAAIGPMVRCGVALPAVFIVGFAIGAQLGWSRAGLGLGLCAVNVLGQTISDPQLGIGEFPTMAVLLCVFFALGRVMRGHTAAVEALRVRTVELRRQRDRTSRLAALADRARISTDIDDVLHERLGRIATSATAGRALVEADSEAAIAQLAAIEDEARDVLQRLRVILGGLDADPPASGPQLTLAEMPALLARTTSADVRLVVEGIPRPLPNVFELTACRIVEHLVGAVADTPEAAADIRLRYTPDALELEISGPQAAGVELSSVLAAARLRAALHGGRLDGSCAAGRYVATAEIPLVSAYA